MIGYRVNPSPRSLDKQSHVQFYYVYVIFQLHPHLSVNIQADEPGPVA